MVLHSLDLFSGLGGITIALEGICKPVAYCEIDPYCQDILAQKMKQRIIPRAPVFHDVCELSAKKLVAAGVKKKIDIIVGGWPCQDLSVLGKKKGLIKGERSGLVREVIRLTDELKPKLLMLENVPPIVKAGLREVIKQFTKLRDYELRWAVIPAAALGAPHVRKRWYGLLIRKGTADTIFRNLTSKHKVFKWSQKERVPRMIIPRDPDHKRDALAYISRLGNSVVPDAVRAAFYVLASGFTCAPADIHSLNKLGLAAADYVPKSHTETRIASKTPLSVWGVACRDGKVYKIVPPHHLVPPTAPENKHVLDPKVFKSKTHSSSRTVGAAELIKRSRVIPHWTTPRFSVPLASVLTERSWRDLSTQVRFERSTPDALRSGIINPAFVEWMMGYARVRRDGL